MTSKKKHFVPEKGEKMPPNDIKSFGSNMGVKI